MVQLLKTSKQGVGFSPVEMETFHNFLHDRGPRILEEVVEDELPCSSFEFLTHRPGFFSKCVFNLETELGALAILGFPLRL